MLTPGIAVIVVWPFSSTTTGLPYPSSSAASSNTSWRGAAASSSPCRRKTPVGSVRHVGTRRRRTGRRRSGSTAANADTAKTPIGSQRSMSWRGGTAWQPVERLRPPVERRPRNPPTRIGMRPFMLRHRNLRPSGQGGCQIRDATSCAALVTAGVIVANVRGNPIDTMLLPLRMCTNVLNSSCCQSA